MNKNNGDKVILTVKGYMKRSRDCEKPYPFYIEKTLLKDINIYCRGTKQSVINELIRIGLEKLKED